MSQPLRNVRQRLAAGEQLRTVRVPEGVQTRALRQLQFAAEQCHLCRHRIWPQRFAGRIRKYQVKVNPIIREHGARLFLLYPLAP